MVFTVPILPYSYSTAVHDTYCTVPSNLLLGVDNPWINNEVDSLDGINPTGNSTLKREERERS